MVELIQKMVDNWNRQLITRSGYEELSVTLQIAYKPTHPGQRLTDYVCLVGIFKLNKPDEALIARRVVFYMGDTRTREECIAIVAERLMEDIGLQGINNAFTVLDNGMYEPIKT